MERERRSEGQHGSDGAEAQEESPHVLRQLMVRAGQGDAVAAHKLHRLRQRRAAARAQTEGGGAMDPSVAALFRSEQSTDVEMGTGEAQVAQQSQMMRLALQKHFDQYLQCATSATKIVTADLAGYGKVTRRPDTAERIGKLAKMAIGLAWKHFGGAAEIKTLLSIAKEELMGPYAEYAEKGYEVIKGQIEKLGSKEISLEEITKALEATVTENAATFVERGKAAVARAPAAQLASSWRLIGGTRENGTTGDGQRYDEGQKETVTTVVLEGLTGINVSPAFAKQLAMTILQQAQADFVQLVGPEGRTEAIHKALHTDVGERVERIAHETREDVWMKNADDARARLN
jgi:hypothetical protein